MSTDLTATASDGTALALTVHGASGTPLLLVPGLGATRSVYDPIVDGLLARGIRPVVLDNRGAGASGTTDGPYTMSQLAADAVAALDAAGLERAHLLGASMGGMVAVTLAIEHPARLDRLVLVCTSPGRSLAVKADREATARLLGRGASTPEAAYRVATEVLYSPCFRRDAAAFVEAEIHRRGTQPVSARGFQGQRAASWAYDPGAALGSIAAPTLVVHGDADEVMPVGNGHLLAERIPGARLLVVPGAGHLVFHEQPEVVVEAVADFLAGEDAAPHSEPTVTAPPGTGS